MHCVCGTSGTVLKHDKAVMKLADLIRLIKKMAHVLTFVSNHHDFGLI